MIVYRVSFRQFFLQGAHETSGVGDRGGGAVPLLCTIQFYVYLSLRLYYLHNVAHPLLEFCMLTHVVVRLGLAMWGSPDSRAVFKDWSRGPVSAVLVPGGPAVHRALQLQAGRRGLDGRLHQISLWDIPGHEGMRVVSCWFFFFVLNVSTLEVHVTSPTWQMDGIIFSNSASTPYNRQMDIIYYRPSFLQKRILFHSPLHHFFPSI